MSGDDVHWGPGGPEYRMGKTRFEPNSRPALPKRFSGFLPPIVTITIEDGRTSMDDMPPRLWPDVELGRLRFVCGDKDVLFSMTTERAREFARQILNSAAETEHTHHHLRAAKCRMADPATPE